MEHVINQAGRIVDLVGVAIIVLGVALGILSYLRALLARQSDRMAAYRETRQVIGRGVLFGLEVLVAGDIIRTVASSPTFTSIGVLALIVLIRTFLSWSLELEMTGRWPWQKGAAAEPQTSGQG